MVEAKKKDLPSLIELMSDRPPTSPEIDFRGVSVVMVLLTREQIEWAKTAAQKRVRDSLVEQYKDLENCQEICQDMLKNDAQTLESRNNWFDCYVLQAALRVPDTLARITKSKDDPHIAAWEISSKFTPNEIDDLMDRYLEWADEHDPHRLTEADIEEIVEAAKKLDPVSLIRYGSNALRVSLIFSVCVGPEPLPPGEPEKITNKSKQKYKRELQEYQMELEEWNAQRAFVISQIVKSSATTASEEVSKNGSPESASNQD